MRLIYHHRTLGDGAEGVHIHEMIEAFRELGQEVEVVCPASGTAKRAVTPAAKSNSLAARLKQLTPRIAFRMAEVAYNAVTYVKMRQAIRKCRPDFIYERYACFNFGSMLAAQRAGVPVILEVNTPYSVAWSLYDRIYFPRLAARIETSVWNRASRVVTVSQALKEHLITRGIPGDRIVVTPNAINPSKVSHELLGKRSSRIELPEVPIIGFVGSLRKWHGIPLLVEAVVDLLKAGTACHLLIVGDGDMRAELEEYLNVNNVRSAATLTGRVSHAEVFPLIAAMDIAVMPDSNFYGSPLKIFEYMAMEKATVAPRLGPLEEVITDRVHGRLFEPRNKESLREVLKELVLDAQQRTRLGKAARTHILQNHCWVQNARTVLDAFEDYQSSTCHFHRSNAKLTQDRHSCCCSP